MRKEVFRLISFVILVVGMSTLWGINDKAIYRLSEEDLLRSVSDTDEPDTTLPYPFEDESGGLYLNDPSNFTEEVEYDPETGNYIVTQKIGGLVSKAPMFMTPEEYRNYVAQKQISEYWQSKTQSAEAAEEEGRDPGSSLIPQIQVNSELFSRIFGSNTIDIRPQGYAELRFGGRIQKVDNPIIPERNRSTFNFDFDQRIQMNVTGKIGEKLQLSTNYDTEATFSFENQMKTEYTGEEDDIVKKIELGNVSLPLNSTLISGAQSLFGVKGQFQFGKLTLTSVISEQRSQSSSINIQGGATTTEFQIWGDQYEANKHYFLSQYFRNNYERFLDQMPLVTSPVQITKVEVWVTNTRQETENTRNIVAFMDLGEEDGKGAYRSTSANLPGPSIFGRLFPTAGFPDNRNNSLDPEILQIEQPGIRDISLLNNQLNGSGFEEATEYVELSNARKLRPTEFTFHPQLGYISLSTSLNQDEVLAVAFQYTAGGRTYQVGEFSTDGVAPPQTLIVKMLKSTILNVKLPIWDLMMKNIYSLNAYQVNREDFRLDILYQNDETGTPIPFLPDGNLKDDLLVRVMDLDQLNNNNDPQADGFFDFVPGITINTQNGRIIFPVLEPFGSNLNEKLDSDESRDRYVFQELYDSTRFRAQNETRLNKFLLKGQFKSASSSEIQLNAFNIPQGSVTVTAGGSQLVENVDYTVDYNFGRVKIINEGILNSGTPIKVDFENNALFNFQTRNFMGLNADYKFNEHLNIGATAVRLTERPLTQKVNIGDEPIANTIWGMNASFTKEAPYLTRAVDAIPFLDTKAKSNLTVQGEFAQLVPGSPSGIKINGEETTYLDDFESSQTSIDIRNPIAWRLASTPRNQPDLFPESVDIGIESGYNRARLAWYTIDPLFHNNDSRTPDNIKSNNGEFQSGQYVRQVLVKEVFPNVQQDQSQAPNIAVLDLAYYPNERGPYNFDVEPTAVSAGIDANGRLNNPSERWGGIMRNLTTTNFEEQNIEFIQFWMMDPFWEGDGDSPADSLALGNTGGDLYFNLGSISEDILLDGKQAVENGIPINGDLTKLDSTSWGYVPKVRPPVIAFDNDPAARTAQDVGYDLMNDAQERGWSGEDGTDPTYLSRVDAEHGQASRAYTRANNDPAADNFSYYRGDALDNANATILDRYKDYNNPENNSDPVQINGVSAFATNTPDIEDINRDQTLSKTEAYYQYKISMRKSDFVVGRNYITDVIVPTSADLSELPNGKKNENTRWYQFKIPIFNPDKTVGPISDFRSIRFIRMFMKNFSKTTVLRFARLELVRGEWRRYQFNLDQFGGRLNDGDQDNTLFEVNAVNIEQNGKRVPVNYVLPPGIDRQVLFGTASSQQQNEQSLSMRVCELNDGAARAVFRNISFDMRMYKRLKMFAHAESAGATSDDLQDDDVSLFIRLGSDYAENYYEYELPLKVTEWGATSEDEIWPAANNIDFALDELKDAKLQRDREYRSSGTSITQTYSYVKGESTIRVRGAPNLSNVRTILIGVRNPRRRLSNDATDDGLGKCAEVWVNELRLTEFDQRGGWAANAAVRAQLADFANVNLSGRMSTVGFGSLDQTVSERQRENIYAYDLQTSFQLGQFFGKDAGLRIPMYFSQSEEWKNPQFNPLDPDIEFDEALQNLETQEERDELKKIAQDYTSRRSINFTNVGKERTGGGGRNQRTPQVYDIENLSASYSFNEVYRSNINTVYDRRRDYMGSLNYTYQTNPKAVEPFKEVEWLKPNYLSLIRDFNFFWYPRNFTAIGTLDRSINEMRMRNTDNFDIELPETTNKSFTFNRQYSLLFDLTKNLKLDFNARMNSRIDELFDNDGIEYTDEEKRAEINKNLRDFGRPTNYHQTININWQVPVNKIPYLEFAQVTTSYTGDYDWSANSTLAQNRPADDTLNFGNTVQNSMQLQLNNRFNLLALYNKVPYLKKVNQTGTRRRGNRLTERAGRRRNNAAEGEDDEEEDEESLMQKVLKSSVRTLLMVRNVTANFSKTEGTLLPGFLPEPELLGLGTASNNYGPGFLFSVGDQADIRQTAVENGWLTQSTLLNNQYTRTYNETMNLRATLEPFTAFRVILTANRSNSWNASEFFRFDDISQEFQSQNSFRTETYSMSYYTLPTAFETSTAPDYTSAAYEQFLENRLYVSNQLADEYAAANPGYSKELVGHPDSADYGYRYFGQGSQQVMIPAFLAAYSGRSIEGFGTNPKRGTPLPNWQITYDGLGKIKGLKNIFKSIAMSHGYRSTYTISGMSTNLLRQQKIQEEPDRAPLDNNGNLLPVDQIGSVILTEQFSPLVGFNVELKNSMSIKLEYKKNRNVSLSMANSQITETKGTEWVIGTGYIIKDVKLKFISLGPRRSNPVSNLEIKADLSIRDNLTIIRKVIEQIDQVTAGQKIVTLKISGDYQINTRVNAKLFYDMNLSRFKTSNAFPITTHQFGISVRLNLGQ